MGSDDDGLLGLAIITTFPNAIPGTAPFDGFRTVRVVVDGEMVQETPFVGATVAEQQANVEQFAASMQEGAQALAEDLEGGEILVLGAITDEGDSVSLVEGMLDPCGQLLYDEALVYAAPEGVTLLEGIVEAGAELAAFIAI